MLRKFLVLVVAAWGWAAASAAEPAGDEAAVHAVLTGYRQAIENRDGPAAEQYFWPDSQIYEQGGVEGDFATYLAHHLGPELHDIASFDFDGVETQVRVTGDFAYAREVYTYEIVFPEAAARAPVSRRGVATSVLARRDGEWRIVVYHSSARAPRPPAQ
jgi:uncharacterized protein (TIGR02246 family)